MNQFLRQRLANQLSRGDVILFTGAGFSRLAVARNGKPVPSVSDLRNMLWPLAFPNQAVDDESSLGDIYDCATRNAQNQVGEALKESLKVQTDKVPDCYRTWFSTPWRRIYTLNVDDLDEAAQLKFSLPRKIRALSALKGDLPIENYDLLSIHLNGRVDDYPEMTFSQRQYGERTARPDPWYQHLVADLLSHPIIFVGTQLDEPPLWQQLELRKRKGQGTRELRPGSYLVTPKLAAARRSMLEHFNIQLVEMTQEEFVSQVLDLMTAEATRGLHAISDRRGTGSGGPPLLRVAELRTEQDDGTGEFLLGRQPCWADIVTGRAVTREFEHGLRDKINNDNHQVILLTGTAGSGKSTTLMRLALEYQAQGKEVLWINPEVDATFQQIRGEVQRSNADVIAMDEIDLFGHGASHLFHDLISDNEKLMIIGSIRSTRLDLLQAIEGELSSIQTLSYTIPHLEDSDIELLLNALAAAHRLGKLRGKSHEEQVAAFRNQAGRQLLVAMIEATSNERFEEKIDRECQELGPDAGLIYALWPSLRVCARI